MSFMSVANTRQFFRDMCRRPAVHKVPACPRPSKGFCHPSGKAPLALTVLLLHD